MKKILLTLGAGAAALAPLASTIACGKSSLGKYNTENDGKIKIWSTFSTTSAQQRSLEEVVNKYNEVKDASDQPVEIVSISGGYSAQEPGLRTKFEAQDKRTLPNLVIGYPDTVGTIARYEMTLDLGENTKLDEFGADRSIFGSDFIAQNRQIAGVDSTGLWTIPIGKSTDMTTINEPVTKYLIDQLVAAGATIATDGSTKIKEIIAKNYSGDIAEIEALFTTKNASGISYTISDDIFTNFEQQLEFVRKATEVVNLPQDHYILGIDSIVNMIYSTVYSMGGANFSNFLFNKTADGYINFNYGNASHASRKNLEIIYNAINETVATGGLFIRDVQYSSDMGKNHRMAMFVGSTAGYSYNTIAAGSGWVLTDASDPTKTFNSPANEVVSITDHAGGYAEVGFRSGSHTNKLRSREYDGAKDAYNYVSDLNAAELKAAVSVGDFLFKYDSRIADVPVHNAVGAVSLSQSDGNTKSNRLFNIPAANRQNADTKTLQQSEMSIVAPATTWDGSASNAKTTLVQGPSIFGVHSNNVQNEQTRKFVQWLYGDAVDFDGEVKMPAERFADGAAYIIPTNNVMSGTADSTWNDAQKLSFNILKDIYTNNDEHAFDNPADYNTGNARTYLKSGFVATFNSFYNNNQTTDFGSFYNNLKRVDVSNKVFK